MRNILAHAGKSGRRVVSALIATAFAQDDAVAARMQWRRVADQLRPKLPKLAALMDEAEPDVLAYMGAPRSSASSPTRPRSFAWSARSCWSKTTNGPAATSNLSLARDLVRQEA